jgi:hypothetical protein
VGATTLVDFGGRSEGASRRTPARPASPRRVGAGDVLELFVIEAGARCRWHRTTVEAKDGLRPLREAQAAERRP